MSETTVTISRRAHIVEEGDVVTFASERLLAWRVDDWTITTRPDRWYWRLALDARLGTRRLYRRVSSLFRRPSHD